MKKLLCLSGEAYAVNREKIGTGELCSGSYRPEMNERFSEACTTGIYQHALYDQLFKDTLNGCNRAALGNIGGCEGTA